MNNKNINKILNNLLSEEIEKKASLMVEKLSDKQRKHLDVAEPKGVLNKRDFQKLGKMKKKETKEGKEMCEQCGGPLTEGECMECMSEGKSENNENWGAIARIAAPMAASYIGSKFAENNEEVEEGNMFTDKLRKTKKGEKFKIGNKTYTDTSDLDEGYMKESTKITFTESEIVELIEKLVIEEKDNIQKKKASANSKLEKSNSTTAKDEKDYMKQLADKMKKYLKDGSKGQYEMNPKHFPKGNGELGEMSKKTYKATTAVDEYIENFTAAGLENLVFDEIHPDEEWMDANIEGSSKTGNSPDYGNAVKTDVNQKRNNIRKQNLLGAAKQLAYNKAPQPTEEVNGPGKKFEKNFGKGAASKVNKILNQLESIDDKSNKKMNEEMERMKNIIGYKSKTQ